MSMGRARVMCVAFGREDVRCRRTTSKGSKCWEGRDVGYGREIIKRTACLLLIRSHHSYVGIVGTSAASGG